MRAYRLVSILGTLKAASRGPGPLARRVVRQRAHKALGGFPRSRKATRP